MNALWPEGFVGQEWEADRHLHYGSLPGAVHSVDHLWRFVLGQEWDPLQWFPFGTLDPTIQFRHAQPRARCHGIRQAGSSWIDVTYLLRLTSGPQLPEAFSFVCSLIDGPWGPGIISLRIFERTHLYKLDCLMSQSMIFGWSLVNSWRDLWVRHI
jgi:hypothetical protein